MAIRKGREWTGRHGLAAAAGIGLLGLLYILKGGPTSGQIATGNLFTNKGVAVTVTRASNKTCTKGAAYFDAAQMLVGPEQLASSPWSTSGATVAASGNGASPRAAAFTLTASGAGTYLLSGNSAPIVGTTTYTASIDARVVSGTTGDFRFEIRNADQGFGLRGSIQPTLTTSWQRITWSTGSNSLDGEHLALLIEPLTASGVVELAAAKLEAGSSATAYVPGNNQQVVYLGTNVPCVDSTGVSLEGTSTNLVLQSAALDNAAWTKTGATVTADQGIAPDGTLSAERVQLAGGTNQNSHQVTQQVTGTFSGTTNTCSFFARTTSGTATIAIHIAYVAVNDYFSGDLTATTTWQRFSFTQVFPANASTGAQCGITIGSALAAADVQVTGMQFEQQPFATTPVPTTTTSAARLNDSFPGIATTLSGTTYCFAATVTTPPGYVWANGGAIGNNILSWGSFGAAKTSYVQVSDPPLVNMWDDSDVSSSYAPVAQGWGTNGGTHRMVWCNAAGTVTLKLDGASVAVSKSGTGTGVATLSNQAFFLGSSFSSSWATLSNVCVSDKVGVCQ